MAVYEWETWTGIPQTTVADKIVFKPGHVVWLTVDDQLVLAERNSNVNHLRQVLAEPGS